MNENKELRLKNFDELKPKVFNKTGQKDSIFFSEILMPISFKKGELLKLLKVKNTSK